MITESPPQAASDRVLVLLDASPGSLSALRAAAALARLVSQRLEAVFIEDVNLLHLAGLPFCREIGSYTASVRLLEREAIEREYRLLAQQLRLAVQKALAEEKIEGSFRVVRGGVRDAVLREASAATFVGVGRAGRFRTPRRRFGSTLQALLAEAGRPLVVGGTRQSELAEPLIVYFTGSDASHRALQLAIMLAERRSPALPIVVAAELVHARFAEHALQVLLAGREIKYSIAALPDPERLRALVRRSPGGTLILPSDAAEFLAEFDRTLLLVP